MNEQSVIVWIALITTIKNLGDGVLAWLAKRDVLRSDKELTEAIAKSLKAEHEVKSLTQKLNEREEKHESSAMDRKRLSDEIEEIKAMISKVKQ